MTILKPTTIPNRATKKMTGVSILAILIRVANVWILVMELLLYPYSYLLTEEMRDFYYKVGYYVTDVEIFTSIILAILCIVFATPIARLCFRVRPQKGNRLDSQKA